MKITPSEHQEQVYIFQWAELNKNKYPELEMLFAIPNGSNKTITQALKFKREGLRSGFLILGYYLLNLASMGYLSSLNERVENVVMFQRSKRNG